jgi:hypothetical protein
MRSKGEAGGGADRDLDSSSDPGCRGEAFWKLKNCRRESLMASDWADRRNSSIDFKVERSRRSIDRLRLA